MVTDSQHTHKIVDNSIVSSMTKQVAFSEQAYAALRRAKQGQESFSQTVLRLLANQPKDALAFVNRPRRWTLTAREHLAQVDADRKAWP